jgi:ubiquinone/menaquinone biosynthesis C-methylase UbiE
MNQTNSGYQFDRLSIPRGESELKRLQYQASLLLPLEREIWTEAGLKSGMSVLDLGCGAGIITRALAEFVQPSQVMGIDISDRLISQARSVLAESPLPNLTFDLGDIDRLNLPDCTYDFIYARLLFQHLDRPLEALKHITRLLKPGGIICLVDIDEDWFSLYPEPASFSQLRSAIYTLRDRTSGDANIGRKLGHYLAQAGCNSISTKIKIVDSDRLGFDRFIDLLSLGSTYQHLQPDLADLARQAREDLEMLKSSPSSWGGFGLFVSMGIN